MPYFSFAGPEKYWTYRWVHAVDGTSSIPFILEIYASSQPEIFNGIYPMTYLVCTQMRKCQDQDSLPYLTSSCETQIFTTAGTRALVRVGGIMNSSKYQAILGQTLQASVRKLKRKFTFQHDNDPKH
uniref:Uncharacterized protein n=1 Tax=Esox lucius TaxID=8010 RepID=A0AAY5K1G4_ESOLU